jgi:gliding motility-associated-like protein
MFCNILINSNISLVFFKPTKKIVLLCCLLFTAFQGYSQNGSPYFWGGTFNISFKSKTEVNIALIGNRYWYNRSITGDTKDSMKLLLFNKDTFVTTTIYYKSCLPARAGCQSFCSGDPFDWASISLLVYETYIDLSDAKYQILMNSDDCEIFVQTHPFQYNSTQWLFVANVDNLKDNYPFLDNIRLITTSFSRCYDWKEGDILAQMPWEPILRHYINTPYHYSVNAIGNHGDSFSYKYETPKIFKGYVSSTVHRNPYPFEYNQYEADYSEKLPLSVFCQNQQCNPNPTANPPRGFSVDEKLGMVVYTPVANETVWLNFRANQYRKDSTGNYVYVGYVEKSYVTKIQGATSVEDRTPTIKAPNSVVACQNDTVRFSFKGYDAGVQHPDSGFPVLLLYYTDLPDNAKITLKDSFTKQKEYLVEWVANEENVKFKQYKIIAQAYWETNDCADNLSQMSAIHTINLITVPKAEMERIYEISSCGWLNFQAESLKGGNYLYHWDFHYEQDSLPYKVSNLKQDSIPLLKKGKYAVKLETKHAQMGCLNYFYDTIDFQGDPALEVTLTPDSLTLCQFITQTFEAEVINNIGTPKWNWFYEQNDLNHKEENLQFSPDSSGKLMVTIEDDKGCKTTDSTHINLLPAPLVALQNDTTICEVETVVLYSNLPDSMYHLWMPGSGTSDSILVDKEDNYVLEVTNTHGCKSSDSVFVFVNPKVPPAFVISSEICSGDSFTLFGLFPQQYDDIAHEWHLKGNSISTEENLRHSLQNTSYLTHSMSYERQGLWCSQEDSVQVIIHPLPKADFDLSDSGLCLRNNLFTATNQSSGSEGNSQWTSTDGQSGTTNPFEVNFAQTGLYSIKLQVQTDKGCKDSLEKQVEVYPHPQAEFTLIDAEQCLHDNEFEVTVSSLDATTQTLNWGNGNQVNNAQNQSYNHTYTTAGEYLISLNTENEFGCTDTVSQNIIIHPQPEGTLEPVMVCESMPVELRSVNTGSENTIHSLLPSGSVKSLSPGGSAIHEGDIASIPEYLATLRMESDKGCIALLSKTFAVHPAPEPTFTWVADRHAGALHFRFTGSQEGNWTAESGETGQGIVWEVGFNDTGMILVTLKVLSNQGCEGEVSELIPVYEDIELYVPNAFSPNADGHNETWKPGNSQFIKEYHVRVWNHWGQMVFQSYNPHQGWNGDKTTQGVYLFIINAKDIYGKNHNVKGTVHLVR